MQRIVEKSIFTLKSQFHIHIQIPSCKKAHTKVFGFVAGLVLDNLHQKMRQPLAFFVCT